jgi:hypothetical protein
VSVREVLARRRADAESANSRGSQNRRRSSVGPTSSVNPTLPQLATPTRKGASRINNSSASRNSRYRDVRPVSAATDTSGVATPVPPAASRSHTRSSHETHGDDENQRDSDQHTGHYDHHTIDGASDDAEQLPAEVTRPRKLSKREKIEAANKEKQEERQRAIEVRKIKRDAIHAERKAEKARREEQLKVEREAQEAAADAPAAAPLPAYNLLENPSDESWKNGDVKSVLSVGGRVVIDDVRHVKRLETDDSNASFISQRSMARSVDDYSRTASEAEDPRDGESRFTEPDEYRPMSDNARTPEPDVAARKPLLKELKVQTAVRNRARADLRVAYKEVEAHCDIVDAFVTDAARDEYDVQSQEKALDEARSMVLVYLTKFAEADDTLRTAVANAAALEGDAEHAAAAIELREPAPEAPPDRPLLTGVRHTAKPPAERRQTPQRRRKQKSMVDPTPKVLVQEIEHQPETNLPAQAPARVPRTPDGTSSPPIGVASGSLPPAGAMGPDAQPPSNVTLSPCGVCGRKFATERLAKHQAVCKKNASTAKKRKTFDTKKSRIQGTDAAQFAGKTDDSRYEAAKKKKNDWKAKSEAFRAAMRSAKDPNAAPAPPADTSHLVPCKFCGRKFNDSAHVSHVKRCKEKSSQPKVVPKGRQRTKYDPRAAAKK